MQVLLAAACGQLSLSLSLSLSEQCSLSGNDNSAHARLPASLSTAHASDCCRSEFWDQAFADSIHWSGDPVVALPDVCELDANEADEFVVLATDGLWCALGAELV